MEMINRTWQVPTELAERINAVANSEKLYPSDLVSYLITVGLVEVEAGRLDIPTKPRGRPLAIDWDKIESNE